MAGFLEAVVAAADRTFNTFWDDVTGGAVGLVGGISVDPAAGLADLDTKLRIFERPAQQAFLLECCDKLSEGVKPPRAAAGGDPMQRALFDENIRIVLALAMCSFIAYAPEEGARKIFSDCKLDGAGLRWADVHQVRTHHTQCFVVRHGTASVVAFRGTEPDRLVDWMLSAQASLVPTHLTGRVRESYMRAVENTLLWPVPEASHETPAARPPSSQSLLELLRERAAEGPLYLTGHSLGGALATLCASMLQERFNIAVHSVVTFGSPKVGDAEYAAAFDRAFASTSLRVVNDKEFAPHNPPWPYPVAGLNQTYGSYVHVGNLVRLGQDTPGSGEAPPIVHEDFDSRLAPFKLVESVKDHSPLKLVWQLMRLAGELPPFDIDYSNIRENPVFPDTGGSE